MAEAAANAAEFTKWGLAELKARESQKISFLPDNPKKNGTKSHARYERYKEAKTVGEFLRLTSDDLRSAGVDWKFDAKQGYLQLGAVNAETPSGKAAAEEGKPAAKPAVEQPAAKQVRRKKEASASKSKAAASVTAAGQEISSTPGALTKSASSTARASAGDASADAESLGTAATADDAQADDRDHDDDAEKFWESLVSSVPPTVEPAADKENKRSRKRHGAGSEPSEGKSTSKRHRAAGAAADEAARIFSDTARLWEAYEKGGARAVASTEKQAARAPERAPAAPEAPATAAPETAEPPAARETAAPPASDGSLSDHARAKKLLIDLLGSEGAMEFVTFARTLRQEKRDAPAFAKQAWEAKLRAVIARSDEAADHACAEVLSRARRGIPCMTGLEVMSFEEARVVLMRCGGTEALNRDRERRKAAASQQTIEV
mmetsp:Transcript_91194/g.174934  ORF Transcript_91194/g.174934 Transcript_91194/m.174934 type:complete len:434 (-) Transcript_91194:88-1389(-)